MPPWGLQKTRPRKNFSGPIGNWLVNIILMSTKPQMPRKNLKTLVRPTKFSRILTNAPSTIAMGLPGKRHNKAGERLHQAMRTSGSTSVAQRIFFRAQAGSVAFLNNSLEPRLGSVVQPRDAAMPVGVLRVGRGTSLEPIGKPAWHLLWKRQRTVANVRFH